MSRSYRIDMFAETGFNAVDIPYCPQMLYDEFDVFKRYQDLPIVQDEWEANIKVDDLTPEEVRKIDYVIIVDEIDTTKMTCYTVKNYKFLSDDVVQINLLLDPYNTMGGFIKGSNDNVVVAGSVKRLTVPLNYKAGVYEQAENKDFFVLNEPFSPATRLKMTYDDFNFNNYVPQIPSEGTVGVVREYIEAMSPQVDKNLASYINKAGFSDTSQYFDSQLNAGLTNTEYNAIINNEYALILKALPNGSGNKLVQWSGSYYGYASAIEGYWYMLSYNDRYNPHNLAEFGVEKDTLINKTLNLLSQKLTMEVISGTPPTAHVEPAPDMVKYQWLLIWTRALQLWEDKIRSNINTYGNSANWDGQAVHVGILNLNDSEGKLKVVNGNIDMSNLKFAVVSNMYKTGGRDIPTTRTIEYYTM